MKKEEFVNFLKNNRAEDTLQFKYETIEDIHSSLHRINGLHIVYERNDLAKSVFLVLSGAVKLKKAFGEEYKTAYAGEFFGLESLKRMSRRRLNAVSAEPSSVLEIFIDEGFKLEPLHHPIQTSGNSLNFFDVSQDEMSLYGFERNLYLNFEMFKYKNTAVVFVNLVKATLIESNSFDDFLRKLTNGGETKIIIDLRACKTVDSTFIGTVVRSYKQVKCKNGDIILVYKKNNISSLFMITCVDKVFKTFNNLAEAFSHIGNL